MCGEDGKEGSGDEERKEREGRDPWQVDGWVHLPTDLETAPFSCGSFYSQGNRGLERQAVPTVNPIPGPGPVYRADELPATTSPARFTAAQAAQSQEGRDPASSSSAPHCSSAAGTVPTCSEATLGLPWRLSHCTPS